VKRLTTALKWFAYGIGLALLFAPRSGRETRQQLIQSANQYMNKALNQGSQAVNQATQKAQQATNQATAKAQQTSDQVDPATYEMRESGTTTTFTSGGPA